MTLRNDDDLRQAMDALANLRLALASLQRDVGTLNPANFAIMAEGTVDEITRIERDVSEYLHVDDVRAPLWMTLSGPGIHVDDAPTSVVTYYLDNFRKGVQAATEHAYTGKLGTRPTAKVQQAADMRFAAVAEGSLRIGIRMDGPGQLELDDTGALAGAAKRSLNEYLTVAAWAGRDEGDATELATLIPDADRRRVLLNLVMQLAPRPRGDVESVEFRGRVVRTTTPARLTRASRDRLANAIDQVEQSTQEEHTGRLRELDLDEKTGIVRTDRTTKVTCEFVDEVMPTASEALGRTVHVVGSRNESGGRRRTVLLVTRMEIIDDRDDAIEDE